MALPRMGLDLLGCGGDCGGQFVPKREPGPIEAHLGRLETLPKLVTIASAVPSTAPTKSETLEVAV